jgi:hypothetical protein
MKGREAGQVNLPPVFATSPNEWANRTVVVYTFRKIPERFTRLLRKITVAGLTLSKDGF